MKKKKKIEDTTKIDMTLAKKYTKNNIQKKNPKSRKGRV